MKNLLKLSLVFAVVLSTVKAHANEDIDFLLFAKSRTGKQISLAINGIQEVSLSIYDKEGQKLFSEKATGELGIERVYSLEEFPAGEYILKVENDFKKLTYKIVITDTKASVVINEFSQLYKQIPNDKEKVVIK